MEVLSLFRARGAFLDGHFRLTSGLHSTGYLQCALVLQDPRDAAALGEAIAARVRDLAADVVLSPALGGIVIGHEVARALGVRAIFAERQDGALTLRRGFVIAPGERVLVVEDVVTTGGSVKEVLDVVRRQGANVVGVGVIVRRGEADFGVPTHALLDMPIVSHDPEGCPQCAAGEAITDPGSRRASTSA